MRTITRLAMVGIGVFTGVCFAAGPAAAAASAGNPGTVTQNQGGAPSIDFGGVGPISGAVNIGSGNGNSDSHDSNHDSHDSNHDSHDSTDSGNSDSHDSTGSGNGGGLFDFLGGFIPFF